MNTPRLTNVDRRRQILEAAKACFARRGFDGTTTKSVAAAAGVSEALLFRHFPTKLALYGEILADACEADPGLHRLLELAPSTATLVTLVREMADHFLHAAARPEQDDAQRIRLLISSQLADGEFARLLYQKIGDLIGPLFTASLKSAVAAGDASQKSGDPLNLFWFAHQTVHMVALTKLSARSSVPYVNAADLDRQVCKFILRGIGLSDAAIASHLDYQSPAYPMPVLAAESA